MIGLLGKKVGMTQIYSEKGEVIPTTILKVGPCYVVQKKTKEKDGYEAIQIGFDKTERLNKPLTGHFKKNNVPFCKELAEIRVNNHTEFNVGQELTVSLFTLGDLVDVTGWTKGRGFSGGMKRWGWHGGPASHGSMSHRRIGSVGSNTCPGRPWRGRTLPGHYGNERVTMKNLKVVKIDPDNHLLYVKGAVPGAKNGLVIVKKVK
ncbi:MAG: 50S ribosomal protein L3 [candidate division WOR-3 bacterium]